MKVIRGISTRSNPIASKIESRNKVKVFNTNKQQRVKLRDRWKTYIPIHNQKNVMCIGYKDIKYNLVEHFYFIYGEVNSWEENLCSSCDRR